MPFFLLTAIVFFLVLRNQPKERAVFVLNALLVYVVLILLEQIYLEQYFNRSFEFSDPSMYLGLTSHLSLEGLINFLSADEYKSNKFYYFLNWLYFNTAFLSEPATGIFLKITNAIFFLFSYLMLKQKDEGRIGLLDWLILFHPWLLYVVIRNVRDIYVIFLLSVLVYFVFKARMRLLDIMTSLLAIVSMYFVRSFFIVPMAIMLLIRVWEHGMILKRTLVVVTTVSFLSMAGYTYKDEIVLTAVNVFLGNAVYFGGESQQVVDELQNDVVESGAINADFQSLLIKKAMFAVPVFLFTPHPYNWAQNYFEQRQGGVYGIYTDADSILVLLGAVLNYLFIYPMMFKYAHYWRQVNIKHIVIPPFIMAFYSIFLMGNADMRIRYTFIMFLIFGFYQSGLTLYKSRKDLKYLFLSLLVLFAIPMISG